MDGKGDRAGGVVTGLADLPREAHLGAAALGRILGRHKKSVERMWHRGDLPPPFKMGGRHVWLVGAIVEHLAARQAAAVGAAKRREERLSGGSLDAPRREGYTARAPAAGGALAIPRG